jgi:hypothetical protein
LCAADFILLHFFVTNPSGTVFLVLEKHFLQNMPHNRRDSAMKISSLISLIFKAALAIAVALVSTAILFGQEKPEKAEKAAKAAKAEYKEKSKGFCSSGDSWNGDRVGFKELREMTVPASGSITVDGGRNGGIHVRGQNRSDILVRACVQTWGTSEEAAKAVASGIKLETSPVVRADGADQEGWSVSFEILVPRSTDLRLTAKNGGISIDSVDGRMEFETTNGGLHLSDIGGDVRGKTTNGGVHVELTGNSWRGSGMDVITTNGGVHLSMPAAYAANIETGTTNGGFHSDIANLNVEKNDHDQNRSRAAKINTALNGGGAPIRLITTNGGVHINASDRVSNY